MGGCSETVLKPTARRFRAQKPYFTDIRPYLERNIGNNIPKSYITTVSIKGSDALEYIFFTLYGHFILSSFICKVFWLKFKCFGCSFVAVVFGNLLALVTLIIRHKNVVRESVLIKVKFFDYATITVTFILHMKIVI